jgi:hypothetical protein
VIIFWGKTKTKGYQMSKTKIFLSVIIFITAFTNSSALYSQMKFNAGMMYGNINGDTISFDLKTDLNDLYFMAMGGTADFGLIKIQWDGVKNPAEVKVQSLTLEKGFVQDTKTRISVIWADFYTQMPYIIKSGNLAIIENSAGVIKGTIAINAELGGSSIIGEMLKGKKETVLKNGYFEITY